MAKNTKYYKLGAKASNFWDPTQPEEDNKKLSLGQVKALTATKAVNDRVRAGGLVLVEEEDYDEYQATLKASKKLAAANESKGLKAAKKQIEVALKDKATAEQTSKDLEAEKDLLEEEALDKDIVLAELNAKVAAYEAGGDTEAANKAVADLKEEDDK